MNVKNLLPRETYAGARKYGWTGWAQCWACNHRCHLSLFEGYHLHQARCPSCSSFALGECEAPPEPTSSPTPPPRPANKPAYTTLDWRQVITPKPVRRKWRLRKGITIDNLGESESYRVLSRYGDEIATHKIFKDALAYAHDLAEEVGLPVVVDPAVYSGRDGARRPSQRSDPRLRPLAPMFPVDSWIRPGWHPEGREILPKPVLQFDYFGEAA